MQKILPKKYRILLIMPILGMGVALLFLIFELFKSPDTQLSQYDAATGVISKNSEDKIKSHSVKPTNVIHQVSGRPNLSSLIDSLRNMPADISSKDHYRFFLDLRLALQSDPRGFEKLRDLNLFDEPKTHADRQRISLIYGILAQSDRPEAWPLLKEALEKGQGEIIGFQAVTAMADYGALAPPEAFDSLWAVSQKHPEPYIRNSAVLALGSIAQENLDIAARVRPLIKNRLETSNVSSPWYELDVTLAAAGNHGDPEYVPFIKKFIDHQDEAIRSRVLFSLRRVPNQTREKSQDLEIITWIGEVASKDLSAKVQLEGLKALSELDLKLESVLNPTTGLEDQGYTVGKALFSIGANARSKEVLQTAVRIFSIRLRYYPESTAVFLKSLRALPLDDLTQHEIDKQISLTQK